MSTIVLESAKFTLLPTNHKKRSHFIFGCPVCEWVYEETVTSTSSMLISRLLCAEHVQAHEDIL